MYICWGGEFGYVNPTGSDHVWKSLEYDTPIDRSPLNSPSLKNRTYMTYRPRSASQNAVLCESNAPFVTTGFSLSFDQRMPSADLNVSNPRLVAVPPMAL